MLHRGAIDVLRRVDDIPCVTAASRAGPARYGACGGVFEDAGVVAKGALRLVQLLQATMRAEEIKASQHVAVPCPGRMIHRQGIPHIIADHIRFRRRLVACCGLGATTPLRLGDAMPVSRRVARC